MVTVVETRGTSHFAKQSRFEEPDNGNFPSMLNERERLNTYKNWPCKFMEPRNLAKAGFFYINRNDIVRCAFCNIEIGQWQQGDNAMTDHRRWSDGCPLVTGQNCGNVPIELDATPMPTPTPPAGEDTCGKYGIEIRPNSFPERESGSTSGNSLNLSKLGVQPSRGPVYTEYATLERRLSSFAEWPRSMKQNPEELASAGFFYNGKGDQTICFFCGGGLKDWEDDDIVWEQHAKWFSKCNFLLLQKGQEYISEICSKHEAILTPDEAAELQITSGSSNKTTPVNPKTTNSINNVTTGTVASTSSDEDEVTVVTKAKEIQTKELASEVNKMSNTNTLCKICYSKEVGVVFLPCGHIIACVDCATALTMCAVCRKPLEATVRAFLS